MEMIDYWGSTVLNASVFRVGGAKHRGVTPYSWKMVATGTGSKFIEPTKSPWISGDVLTDGSKIFRIEAIWDGAAPLDDDQMWFEIEFLGTASGADTQSTYADTRMANITATAAAVPTSTETWSGVGGFSAPKKMVLTSAALSIGRVGPIRARLCLASAVSLTAYGDPKIQVENQ